MKVEDMINALIDREGGYVDNPNDRGGPTRWGITENEARAHGYTGDMKDYPKDAAFDLYLHKYWVGPGFDQVALRSEKLADELLDTGVNMGPQIAGQFLQRSLNVLNRRAGAYPDVLVDGNVGKMTLYALDQFIVQRGIKAIDVLFNMLNALQSVRYITIAEANPSQEEFEFGWQLNRVTMGG